MDGYLSKPIQADALLSTINNYTQTVNQLNCQNPEDELVDVDGLMARVQGDSKLLADIIRLFIEESPKILKEMREALTSSDMSALSRAAHRMKGSAGNLSSKACYDAALRLESVAKINNLDSSKEAYQVLEAVTERLMQRLACLITEKAA
jgi:HPt (histidine-containing phosphotransfer) domain-containing protein